MRVLVFQIGITILVWCSEYRVCVRSVQLNAVCEGAGIYLICRVSIYICETRSIAWISHSLAMNVFIFIVPVLFLCSPTENDKVPLPMQCIVVCN